MILYNPTQEQWYPKCHGNRYPLGPGKTIEVTDETVQWILDKHIVYGIVNIRPGPDTPKEFDYKNFVAKKAMEGIKVYLTHLHDIIENFVELDSEIKATNY